MLERYLLAWLLAICGVAFWWPEIFGAAGDPFVASKRAIPWLLAATMFAVGTMMPRDEVRQVVKRWPHVLFGTAIQYSVMPLLGWAAARWSGLGPDYQIGIILVGCVPGAMASNVITLNARGHTSYSVSLTTASTLLSPIVVPFTLSATLGAARSGAEEGAQELTGLTLEWAGAPRPLDAPPVRSAFPLLDDAEENA